MRTYVRMVVCVHLPRFELLVAAGDGSQIARQALAGRALAVAPPVGARAARGGGLGGGRGPRRERRDAARRGARPLPRARARAGGPGGGGRGLGGCAARPGIDRRGRRAGASGPGLLRRRAGCAGSTARTRRRSRPRAARCSRRPARMGAGPTRFCALAAALAARSRRTLVLEAGGGPALARRPAGRAARLPRARPRRCWQPLSRLGVRTLGELAQAGAPRAQPTASARRACSPTGWPAARTARCGRAACRSVWRRRWRSATPSSGVALERVLGVLVDRLLARPERRGRTLRAVIALRAPARGRRLARARGLPPGALRPRAHPAGAVGAPAAAARPGRRAAAGRRALRAAGRRAGHAGRRWATGRRSQRMQSPLRAARAARLREAVGPDARRGRAGRGAAGRLRGSRLARARAAGGARADPRMIARRRSEPSPARARALGRRATRPRSTAKRSSRCASPGWWRTAGGPPQPLRRRYWELVGERGRNVVVFHDLHRRRRRGRVVPAGLLDG